MRFSRLAALAFAAVLFTAGGYAADVLAQTASTTAGASALPERIQRPMRAVDPVTLRAEGLSIRLWGIRPATSNDTPLELRAIALMDTLIQEGQVNCKLEGGVIPELVGRCVVQTNQDLALELLSNGYAIVDRRQTYNTVFATNYERAQEQARALKKGVWALLDRQAVTLPKWLQSDILAPLVIFGGMLLGFAFNAVVMMGLINRVAQNQNGGNLEADRKEALLQSRERQVLLATLEAELNENKTKMEAFLSIYGDYLKGLKDPVTAPKYQQAGDTIQKHPGFSKTVFEANVSRLSLLDIKLAGHLSKLYSALPKEQEYITLDTNLPLEIAVSLLEKNLEQTEDLLEPIDQVIREMQEASRN